MVPNNQSYITLDSYVRKWQNRGQELAGTIGCQYTHYPKANLDELSTQLFQIYAPELVPVSYRFSDGSVEIGDSFSNSLISYTGYEFSNLEPHDNWPSDLTKQEVENNIQRFLGIIAPCIRQQAESYLNSLRTNRTLVEIPEVKTYGIEDIARGKYLLPIINLVSVQGRPN